MSQAMGSITWSGAPAVISRLRYRCETSSVDVKDGKRIHRSTTKFVEKLLFSHCRMLANSLRDLAFNARSKE